MNKQEKELLFQILYDEIESYKDGSSSASVVNKLYDIIEALNLSDEYENWADEQ